MFREVVVRYINTAQDLSWRELGCREVTRNADGTINWPVATDPEIMVETDLLALTVGDHLVLAEKAGGGYDIFVNANIMRESNEQTRRILART